MNYFACQAAERYVRSHPYFNPLDFHALVIDKIRKIIELTGPVDHALDVGCGTGESTVALKGIAQSVIGVEASLDILAFASKTEGVRYVASPAEQIPLPDGAFDLITVSLAFHWFDRPAFFTEANRLLRTNGYLVIYNNAFYGAMRENSGFQNWLIEEFLIRYPTPSRNNIAVTDMEVHPYGLRFLQDQKYENEVVFTVEELASYLVTQSNVIVAVEQGKEKAEAVYDWIVQQATSFFSTAKGTFLFGGYITIGANRD